MATVTTTTSTRAVVTATNNPVCVCGPEASELIARAECFLRLEEQSEHQRLLIEQRREAEQDRLFKTLCASPELSLARLAEAWKAYETAKVQFEADSALVTQFQAVVSERITTFGQLQGEVMLVALEKRRTVLREQLDREQQDTIVVENRIKLVERRIGEIPRPAAAGDAETKQTIVKEQTTTEHRSIKKG